MPKKSANARSGASRNRPRPQKSVQLVRPVPAESQRVIERDEEETSGAVATSAAAGPIEKKAGSRRTRVSSTAPAPSSSVVDEPVTKVTEEAKGTEATGETAATEVAEVAAPRSASARMAARRKATQNMQARRTENLITAEHYSYVRKDLIFIAILAFLMLATLVVLHFVPGIGS